MLTNFDKKKIIRVRCWRRASVNEEVRNGTPHSLNIESKKNVLLSDTRTSKIQEMRLNKNCPSIRLVYIYKDTLLLLLKLKSTLLYNCNVSLCEHHHEFTCVFKKGINVQLPWLFFCLVLILGLILLGCFKRMHVNVYSYTVIPYGRE